MDMYAVNFGKESGNQVKFSDGCGSNTWEATKA